MAAANQITKVDKHIIYRCSEIILCFPRFKFKFSILSLNSLAFSVYYSKHCSCSCNCFIVYKYATVQYYTLFALDACVWFTK